MEGPKVFWVMCITVVGVVYPEHHENRHSNNWRHTQEEVPSIPLEQYDKAAVICTKDKCIQKASQPSKLSGETRKPDDTKVQNLTVTTALPETTTAPPMDCKQSWYLETYWSSADDELKPSWRSSVIIPILTEPKSKRLKERVSIKERTEAIEPPVGYYRL